MVFLHQQQNKDETNSESEFIQKRIHRCYPYRFFSSPASFADYELPLDSEGSELLADTFDILSLKDMKLTSMSGPAAGEEPQEDEMAMAKAVLQVAQKKLVSQVRRHPEGSQKTIV